ncbi:HD domain-containing phosphohydrolase [Chitinivorax sp. PXF-14]|uniref:HD domain-containing phosphohydrolase n=1 Tax=Chitinivorax sp. PXF-14 TaxID=3230488 RepID=UPI003467E9DC
MQVVEQFINSLYTMAAMVEARDPYTGGHLWRVSQFTALLAEDLNLPRAEVARISLGGFLHDLGKVGVPDAVLKKPAKLTEDEYAVIKTHPGIGERLMQGHPLARLVRTAILQHHETHDGRGYPLGSKGDDIPLDARIVAIADTFDALTSTRPYRRGMPVGAALDIIGNELGRQFDTALGKRFIALGEAGLLHHIVGHSEPGIPLQICPMCGPTIVVRRDQHSGDHVYCRTCGAETMLTRTGEGVSVAPTGRLGSAEDLKPDVDRGLVAEMVAALAPSVSAAVYAA